MLTAMAVFAAAKAPAKKAAKAPAKSSAKKKPTPAPKVSAKARADARQYADQRVFDGEASPLERPEALIPFFERLYRLEHDPEAPSVHALQFGDSHTAGEEWTGAMRAMLQSRFRDGGSGFSLAGRPFRGYRRIGERTTMSRGWATAGLLDRDGDGNYGLGGAAIETKRPGETIALDAEGETAELWFLRQPGGGTIAVAQAGQSSESVATDGDPGLGVVRIDAPSMPLEVATKDSRPVRLLGWVVEKAHGITYESMGINGAQASLPGYWNREMWTQQIARRDPALVVLAYGTNEASNRDWDLESYRAAVSALIARIRAAAPLASILLVGPPDRMYRVRGVGWRTFPRMDEIVEAQRLAAAERHCAFWDWRQRMGGAGAMRRWVTAGYAGPDHVHFTSAGYQLIGEVVTRDILSEYARFAKIRERVFEKTTNGTANENPPNPPERLEERRHPGPR